MKYLKKYENLEKPKYKVGDYVLLDVEEMTTDIDCINIVFGKNWRESDIKVYIFDYDTNNNWPYYVTQFLDMPDLKILADSEKFTSVSENEIKRKLTPEEIEIFKIELDAKKYNL